MQELVVVGGRPCRTVPEREQWPASAAPREWAELCGSVFAHGGRLSDAVSELSEAQLARPIENRDYSLADLLHGFNQHTAYRDCPEPR